jgi:uncharacterized protein
VDLTPVIPQGKQVIGGYGRGGFTVNGVRLSGSIIVVPDRTAPWQVTRFDQIGVQTMQPLIALAETVDLVILGTGRTFEMLQPGLRAELRACGLVIEAMATDAACRTYNVLLAEDRKVAAALIAV